MKEEVVVSKMANNEVYMFMFSFPGSEENFEKGVFEKYMLFTSRNETLLERLEKMMHDLNFTKVKEIEGWRKWMDPSTKISRKIFDR
jgi:hypothetical protein